MNIANEESRTLKFELTSNGSRLLSYEPASPPKIALSGVVRGWVGILLSVMYHTGISHVALLRHSGRSSKRLADARRLLVWSFLEVVDEDEDLGVAWLEQCVQLDRKTILLGLKDRSAPVGLTQVLGTYQRLMREMGADDVKTAATSGLLGKRYHRPSVWPRGFLARLGLEATTRETP